MKSPRRQDYKKFVVQEKPEFQFSTAQVLIVVKHPFQERVSRFFSDEERMLAIYDWVGSLDLHPEHFQPACTIGFYNISARQSHGFPVL